MAQSYNTTKRFRRVMLIIPAIFLLIFFGVVQWEANLIGDADQAVSAYLNSWVGASEMLDLTVAFVSSPAGDYFIAIVMIILAWQIVSKRQSAGWATFVSLGLYVGIILAATYGTVRLMDEYIMRPGPSQVLANYQSPWEMVGASDRPPRHTPFPSERGAICGVVFFLFLFRYGSRSLGLLGVTLAYGLILGIAGEAWPSDYVGGIIYGWIVSVFIYMVGFYRMPRYTEEMLIRSWRRAIIGGEGSLFSILRKKKKRHIPGAGEVENLPLGSYSLPDDIIVVLDTNYGIPNAKAIDKPHKGKLYPVMVNDRKVAVKISRSSHKDSKRLDFALATAVELRETGALDMPEILPTKRGDLTVSYHGQAMYLMEWIEGVPVDIQTEEGARQLMELMAKLHSHPVAPGDDRASMGPPDYINQVKQRFHKSLEMFKQEIESPLRQLVPNQAEFEDANVFFEHAQRSIRLADQAMILAVNDESQMRWSVVHKDSHEMNYLVTGDNRIVMLDFDLMRVDIGINDLIKPLRKLMKRTRWNIDAFTHAVDEYVAIRPLERYELVLLLSHLLYPFALSKMKGKTKKGRKLRRGEFQMMIIKERIQLGLEETARNAFLDAVSDHYNLHIESTTTDSGPAVVPLND